MNLSKIKTWWKSLMAARRNNQTLERLSQVESSLQLTTSNGRAYIAHRGIGVRELDQNITLAQAIHILTMMRENAVNYAKYEENLF